MNGENCPGECRMSSTSDTKPELETEKSLECLILEYTRTRKRVLDIIKARILEYETKTKRVVDLIKDDMCVVESAEKATF